MAQPIPTYELIDVGAVIVSIAIIVTLVALRNRNGDGLSFPRSFIRGFNGIVNRRDLLKSFGRVLILHAGASKVLETCRTAKRLSHLSIFWGFVFLAISTTLAYFTKPEGVILTLSDPVKIFGNLGGLLVIGGGVGMFCVRYQQSRSIWHLNRSDYFLIVLILAVVTGFAIEASIYAFGRGFATAPLTTAALYWLHMFFVVLLLATAPVTKFYHALYKPLWLLYEDLENKFWIRRGTRTASEG